MGYKALPVLIMFLVTILLMSTKVAPRDLDEKFDQNDGKLNPTKAIDESKYSRGGFGGRGGFGHGFSGPWHGGYGGGFGGPWRGGFGGPWRGGYGGPWGGGYGGYCPFGCCDWGYYGGCFRCCYYPGERVEANIDAKPYN